MHGLDYAPTDPVEAIAPPNATSRTRFGITIRRQEPRARDVVKIRNLGATSLNRTLLDFASGQAAVEALVAIDMAIRLRKTTGADLVAFANDRSPAAGCVRLRELAALGEPAESPMETRVRLLFIDSGLPRPLVQTDLFDKHGSFIGRADLYYPEARLVIEFDGVNHKNRLVADNRRQNNITSADFTVLRFTTADLMDRPHVIVAQVRGILAGATSSARQPSQMSVVRPANATLTSHGR
jgi:hypothetical protein